MVYLLARSLSTLPCPGGIWDQPLPVVLDLVRQRGEEMREMARAMSRKGRGPHGR